MFSEKFNNGQFLDSFKIGDTILPILRTLNFKVILIILNALKLFFILPKNFKKCLLFYLLVYWGVQTIAPRKTAPRLGLGFGLGLALELRLGGNFRRGHLS